MRRGRVMADVLVVPPMFTCDVVEMPSADHIAKLEELGRQPGGGVAPQYKALPSRARGVRLQITALQVMSGLGS